MENKTLEKLLIENLTANTWWKPMIIGDIANSTTIALVTTYEGTYDCEFVVTFHYSKTLDKVSVLNIVAIDGFIRSSNIDLIEKAVIYTNTNYKNLTSEPEIR